MTPRLAWSGWQMQSKIRSAAELLQAGVGVGAAAVLVRSALARLAPATAREPSVRATVARRALAVRVAALVVGLQIRRIAAAEERVARDRALAALTRRVAPDQGAGTARPELGVSRAEDRVAELAAGAVRVFGVAATDARREALATLAHALNVPASTRGPGSG